MRFIIILLLFLGACTDSNKSDILELLSNRDASISQQDIHKYSLLLSEQYRSGDGKEKIAAMKNIFERFDKVEMNSRDRELRVIDSQNAICEQTYVLKVLADGDWREIVQREQLTFKVEGNHWKINGGL